MNNFDVCVDRTGMSSVKQAMTPEVVRESGVMSLWGAEFEFPTAQFVVDAVVNWAKKGLYAYTVEDDDFLRLVCNWMRCVRRWEVQPDWIVPVYGITSSLATAMRAFTHPGDGIIGLDPGYHMYWDAVELSKRRKVPSKMRFDGTAYQVDWKDLEKKMQDERNKILVVCNPHNPTGKVFSRQELRHLVMLAETYGVLIFNDEIFAECVYGGVEMPTFGQFPHPYSRVITATSLGKWLSFTGTNQANLIIPDHTLREQFVAERDREFYGSMNPMMLPAYQAAYTPEGAQWVTDMMAYVGENYRLVDTFFKTKLPSFKVIKPSGTFVLWVDAREFCVDSEKLQSFLINKAHFHVDPGTQYSGDPGFFRMTLSIPRAELERALRSLKTAVDAKTRNLPVL